MKRPSKNHSGLDLPPDFPAYYRYLQRPGIEVIIVFLSTDGRYLFGKGQHQLSIPCGTKFLRSLIFEIFPAIRKNKFPQIKLTETFCPSKFTPECLFNCNLSFLFRNKAVYNLNTCFTQYGVCTPQYCLKICITIGVSVKRGPDTSGWRMRMGKCGSKNADGKKKCG